MTELRPDLDGTNLKIAIISSEFAEKAGGALDSLRENCLQKLAELGVDSVEFRVPGAFEIPTAAKKVLLTGQYKAVIALGVVVRGETAHFDFVAGNCARKLADLGAEFALPVIFGVLTTETVVQAETRSKLGADYAETAVKMVNLLKKIG